MTALAPTQVLPGHAQLSDQFRPEAATIRSIDPQIAGSATYWLELQDSSRHAAFRFEPGQFNMLYVPGVGEVAISFSGMPDERTGIGHTIRFVGQVTRVIEQMRPGDVLGLRGPYGTGWPMAEARGHDVLIVAGGLGLAPLRPFVKGLLAQREQYGRLVLAYGAREPADLLYRSEYRDWEPQGLEMLVTVDRADPAWHGRVGVVPSVLARLALDPARTAAFVCGPEVMMRYSVYELLARQVPPNRIYLSLERNMQCAEGFCGRCQLGPYFLCKDGPVLAYNRVRRFFHQADF